MIRCKNCGCRLYDDFGLGLYNYETGSSMCPAANDDLGDHVKIRNGSYPHAEDSASDVAANVAKQLAQKQEEYLIRVFGSRERAMQEAHLYILEDHGTKFEAADEQTLSATWSMRLRKKTPEELALEEASQE